MNKIKILHLEDDRNDAELIRTLMDDALFSFNYKCVENEKDFIISLLSDKFDIILSDYSLPTYDGLSALGKSVAIQPDTPFIFVSGTLGEDVAVETLKQGATDYVLKNKLSRLLPTIYRALEETSQREKRKKAEERYGTLIDSARDIISTITIDGKITSLNPAFEAITGWRAGEWIGKEFKGLVHPDDLAAAEENFKRTFDGKISTPNEVRFHCRNGGYFTGEVLITPLFTGNKINEILGLVRDVTERKKSEEMIKSSLKDKETLLKEIHHRVKNNLQIISSLLQLQTNKISDPLFADILKDLRTRVIAMTIIHKQLYQSEFLSRIDIKNYTEQLTQQLFYIYGINKDSISINITSDKIEMDMETALPCGLIINEIISNSIKHAFKGIDNPLISLDFKKNEDDKYVLKIKDNGIGFNQNSDFKKAESMGLQLIYTLLNQLDGLIIFNSDNGTEYTLTFSSLNYKERI